jgi:hypothetical protein
MINYTVITVENVAMQANAHHTNEDDFLDALSQEGKQIPEEHRARLLQIVHLFRESVSWPSAAESFESGWQDIKAGRVHPIDTLWDGIDAD